MPIQTSTTPYLKYLRCQADLAKDIFLDNIKISTPNYQSNQNPFFVANLDEDGPNERIFQTETDKQYISKLNDFWEETKLSRLLYYIYLYLGRDNIEFTLNDYNFYSLSELIRRYNIYKSDGQKCFCDLALTYIGMGHVKVLSFSIGEKLIFARHDGGSNGWDREAHWKFSLGLNPSEHLEKLYDLDDFLQNKLDDSSIVMVN